MYGRTLETAPGEINTSDLAVARITYKTLTLNRTSCQASIHRRPLEGGRVGYLITKKPGSY
jgi:hypothetical protein